MNAIQVRKAFKDMTGTQIGKRNERFEQGWRIADHWCGRYLIAYKDELVTRVEKSSTGLLNIQML